MNQPYKINKKRWIPPTIEELDINIKEGKAYVNAIEEGLTVKENDR